MSYKPDGYNALSAYLLVADAQAALDFIAKVFGASPVFTHRQDQVINHAEIRIDDTILMIGQAPGSPAAHLHLYVADVDAVFAKAMAAGGTLVQEPSEKGDGDRRGGVTDPAGTTWWFATMIENHRP